ncbi:MAG TPA: hypothetical protein VHV55_18130 [Pirellulales bacterium]|jgi:hypothetical protein|nr:hypothetical protein [Pirellulales bacterium]
MKCKTLFWLVLAGIVSAAVITQAEPGDGPRSGPPQRDGADGPPPPPPPKPPIEVALDVNDDGEISATEIAGASAALGKLDKNGDGKLTPEEYRPRRRRPGMGPGDSQASPGQRRPRRSADGDRPPRNRDGDKSPGDKGPGDKGPGNCGDKDQGDKGDKDSGKQGD